MQVSPVPFVADPELDCPMRRSEASSSLHDRIPFLHSEVPQDQTPPSRAAGTPLDLAPGHPDPWDRFWSSRAHAGDFYPQHERIERALRDLGPWRDSRAVEIGCGAGGAGEFLLELGTKPILVDFSGASLRKCRQRFPAGKGITLVRADVFHLPFKDGVLDVLFHQGLLEHFRGDQPRALLQENLRALRPGGWLLVDLPQAFHWESFFARPLIWMGKWFAGWQTYYTLPGLKHVARSLELEDLRYFGSWMNPSFFYRALRWALKSWILLPLAPHVCDSVARLRQRIRSRFFYHPIVLWTGASIGFAGRKPAVSKQGVPHGARNHPGSLCSTTR